MGVGAIETNGAGGIPVTGMVRFDENSVSTGGKNLYGLSVGILILDSRFPRIPGDVGNAGTWPYPVQFRAVKGATPDKIVRHLTRGDGLAPIVEAAKDLERLGVSLISTGCGFLVLAQERLQYELSIPVLTSSLLQVPWVAATLPAGKAVGIMTVESSSLGAEHLAAAHITADMPVVIGGMETAGGYFTHQILQDCDDLDVAHARAEHVALAKRMLTEHPEIGAFVLECTNMPPYAAAISDATGLPVHDLTTMVGWGVAGVARRGFGGWM